MSDSKTTDSEMTAAFFDGTLWDSIPPYWWDDLAKEDIADKLRAKYDGDTIEAYN